MLRKDLLRVSRAGGGYRPRFVDADQRPLAARVLGVYQGHVGEPRERLREALSSLEPEADHFKIVRGFAALLDRDARFETRAPVPPERVRRAAFEAAEAVGVVTEAERTAALDRAGDALGLDADEVEAALYADRDSRQVLASFDPRWSPDELLEQYNLSAAQTALFDAVEVRVRSADPKALVSAVKRLGLLYEIRATDAGREVVATGPDALFRRTRRYGTAFARLLRTVAATDEWTLTATIDDRGTERELRLADGDVSVPGVEPVAGPTYDSDVEADFAARFSGLDLDWELVREPEPLAAGERVMIPDFAFDYEHADFRVFFEIMGFWTPEYVEKKLDQLATVEDVELVVAVDESLGLPEERSTGAESDESRESDGSRADRPAERSGDGDETEALASQPEAQGDSGDVGAAIVARDHRVVPFRDSVRVKDVTDVLREYEEDLLADATASLPSELVPDADAVSIAAVAAERGVAEDALDGVSFPEHRRVGRTLVRPAVLEAVRDELEPGTPLSAAEEVLDAHGVDEASAALSALGYRVAWTGLDGGTLREKSQ